METVAQVVASPSNETDAGRMILKEHPDSTGSLGIAHQQSSKSGSTDDQTMYFRRVIMCCCIGL